MSNDEQQRIEAENLRISAEEGRVIAEASRAHAESNEGSGRVEAEERRVVAEELREKNAEKFDSEMRKFQIDPEHYVSPGAHRILRRFTYAWIILAVAAIAGVWSLTNESKNRVEDINHSRAVLTYSACLDQNNRHDNTILQLNNAIIARKTELRKQIKEAELNGNIEVATSLRGQIDRIDDSKVSTIALIEALAPHQNCNQLSIDKFGHVPNINEKD